MGQNSSAHVARVVGLQTDAVVVTETRFSMFKESLKDFGFFLQIHKCIKNAVLQKFDIVFIGLKRKLDKFSKYQIIFAFNFGTGL